MLRLDGLEIAQGSFRLRADLDVPQGASVAVIGPSGGGKSTLLAAISGFLRPISGRVLWMERDLGSLPPSQRPVGMLFQDNNLFPHLTTLQNVALALRPTLRPSSEERAKAGAALARVGLEGLEHRRPAELSGGQQGRVALARLLLQNQPLALMDEPFAALGPALRSEMLALTRSMLGEQGATLLMVTHDPGDARALGGSVIVVADGLARAPVPVDQLFADPPAVLQAYLGSIP
jgi:thiamine transport system ATP-binding protein